MGRVGLDLARVVDVAEVPGEAVDVLGRRDGPWHSLRMSIFFRTYVQAY